ncbi:hypothetical protein [Actinopolyspora alba]|uniref:hypothetical protein n=1 Tax=Actinopolyspora alba TaxID=673379 RepID=UPI000B85A4FB|nr:hypothetical protein [Actinopolyspora alba]
MRRTPVSGQSDADEFVGVLEGAEPTPVPAESSTAEVVGMDAADEGPDDASPTGCVGRAAQPVTRTAMTSGNSVTIHRGLMVVMIARIDIGGCRAAFR